ncbi:UNVERIFIED_CONTAM: hypothetical protein P3D02_14520, partial [Pseudomonas aeruginosa]
LNPFPFLYIPQFSRFTLLVYLTLSQQENAVGHGVSGVGGDALEPGTASPHDEESKRPFKSIACWRWGSFAYCSEFCEAFRALPGWRLVRAEPPSHRVEPLGPSKSEA